MPKKNSDPVEGGAFYVANGRLCVLLGRTDEWQLGYVFPKGDFADVRSKGIEFLRGDIATIVPWLGDRVDGITDLDQVHLLSVKADRLPCWYQPGVLLIGDAAHAMSPVGGVGINYAINDAVETANVLIPVLAKNQKVTEKHLLEVQSRRVPSTIRIQQLQTFLQNNIVKLALQDKDFDLPLAAKLLLRIPGLRDIPARTIALGVTPVRLDQP